jgi:hypothetical protein
VKGWDCCDLSTPSYAVSAESFQSSFGCNDIEYWKHARLINHGTFWKRRSSFVEEFCLMPYTESFLVRCKLGLDRREEMV